MKFDLIAIEVGNTRTRLGRFSDDRIEETSTFANDALATIVETALGWWTGLDDRERDRALVIASVNDAVTDRLAADLSSQTGAEIHRVGRELAVPIGESLDPETIVGQDRLLAAAAAWDVLKQACIVVDAGTAVTVDFVDGQGVFHGGAIAPGARMQLDALHERTASLPQIDFRRPDPAEAFGRNTAEAMLHGVFDGIRGLVWRLVEQYSERYGAFPLVVATGGDAQTLFGDDELVNRIVPELTLQGIAVAARTALADVSEDGDDGGSTA